MRTIRPLDLATVLEQGNPVEILDIRPCGRFERTHIDGAHWLPANAALSLPTLFFSRELLPTEPLYLVSETGTLAQLMARELERQGIGNVIVLGGGMRGWEESGLPLAGRISHFHRPGNGSATNAQSLTNPGEPDRALDEKLSVKCK
jgi:rhodanese-related sulfurtransferase